MCSRPVWGDERSLLVNEEIVYEPFMQLVPAGGWIKQYMDWTLRSEPPAAFHFFVATAIIGAVASRKVWIDKGYYKVYPAQHLILVAPTGKCRKTSALNLGVNLLRQVGVDVLADKITPEALADALGSTQLIEGILLEKDAIATLYAPELAVFLGKQRYNEGMIALLTALFDNPDSWSTQTKHGKGKVEMKNTCLTFLGASTPDWLMTAIPQDAFGGGFMSRLLFIAQDDTPRCYPFPTPPGPSDHLVSGLQRMQEVVGEIPLTPDAREWYALWYTASKKNIPEDSKMAGYHERKPDHILKMAMTFCLGDFTNKISTNHLIQSSVILTTVEKDMLLTFKWLGVKDVGIYQERLIRILRSVGGKMPYHLLLSKMIFYMDIVTFRRCLETLEQSHIVTTVENTCILHEEALRDL